MHNVIPNSTDRTDRNRRARPLIGLALLTLSLAACGSAPSTPTASGTAPAAAGAVTGKSAAAQPVGTQPIGSLPLDGSNPYAGNPDVATVPFSYDGTDHSWNDTYGGVAAQALSSGDNALSAQAWTSATNGWGPVESNMSNAEALARDGKTLTIAGKTYSSGLGVHAPSQLVYALNGQCSAFQGEVGLDSEVKSLGSVIFQVWADGTKLFDSGRMTGGMAAKPLSVSLAGKKELKLVVTDAGDGGNYDHADWAVATLKNCTVTTTAPSTLPPTVSPTSTTQAISSSVGMPDTSYPVPSDAIVVSTSGSDSAAGTLSAPFRTLARALRASYNRPGVTIVMRGGSYYESPGVLSTRVVIQPYPHEQVWLKGSTVVSGWRQNGSTWVKDNWTSALCQTCAPSGSVTSVAPMAASPDMVFIDGQALRQVAYLSNVTAGSFYLDTANKQLVIGADPSGRTLEAAVSSSGLHIIDLAAGTVVRGIGFTQYGSYANPGGEMAAVMVSSPNVTFENTVFTDNAARGLMFSSGSSDVVRGSSFLNNGLMGLGGWQVNGLLLDGNTFSGNNRENFNVGGEVAEAAGAKIVGSYDVTARNNVFQGNQGSGLWFDVSSQKVLVSNNTFRNNLTNGVALELSNDVTLFSNLFVGNRGAGLEVSNTNSVQVYNNTLVRNGNNMRVTDDSRVNPDAGQFAKGLTWVTGDVHFVNNISSESLSATQSELKVIDYNSSPLKTADQMLVESDFNGYFRSDAAAPKYLVEWWRNSSGYNRYYLGLTDFRSATGREQNGLLFDNQSNPFFVDPSSDFHLKAGSPAIGAGSSLPASLASRVGVNGSNMSLGAVSWPQ